MSHRITGQHSKYMMYVSEYYQFIFIFLNCLPYVFNHLLYLDQKFFVMVLSVQWLMLESLLVKNDSKLNVAAKYYLT